MAIDNSFIIKRIGRLDELFVLFSEATNMPFAECDEETGNDQVYAFSKDERAQDAAHSLGRNDYGIKIARLPNKAIPGFLQSLHTFGINHLVMQDEGAPVAVEVDKLCDRPDIEAMKMDRLPRANPELQLTACYFLQELRRKVDHTSEYLKELRPLEEEMAHNLVGSRFIVTFDTSDIKGKWNPQDKRQKAKIPLVTRNSDGAAFQPIYTEFAEFQKFVSRMKEKGSRMNLIAASFDRILDFLLPSSRGFAVNPGGFNLILSREQIEKIQKTYGAQE